jgi:hypothetical protein
MDETLHTGRFGLRPQLFEIVPRAMQLSGRCVPDQDDEVLIAGHESAEQLDAGCRVQSGEHFLESVSHLSRVATCYRRIE